MYRATESGASGWEDFLGQMPKSLQVAVSAPQNSSASIFRSNQNLNALISSRWARFALHLSGWCDVNGFRTWVELALDLLLQRSSYGGYYLGCLALITCVIASTLTRPYLSPTPSQERLGDMINMECFGLVVSIDLRGTQFTS